MNPQHTTQLHNIRFDVAVAVLAIGMVFGALMRYVA
jgi:hypothetical protein